MLTKEIVIGKIEIQGEDGRISVREDTVIFEDGKELARTFTRRWIDPGADVSNETDARLKDVAVLVFTPEVISAFQVAELKRIAAIKVPVAAQAVDDGA